jgi:hypothetical protein
VAVNRNKLVIGVAVVMVLAAIGGCAEAKSTSAGTVAPTPGNSVASTLAGASQTPGQTAAPSLASGVYKVGDRVKLGDEEYFSVTQVDPAVKATGVFKPEAGKKWVAALVQIEGIGTRQAV